MATKQACLPFLAMCLFAANQHHPCAENNAMLTGFWLTHSIALGSKQPACCRLCFHVATASEQWVGVKSSSWRNDPSDRIWSWLTLWLVLLLP
jgi:hypothetical protein